MTVSSPLTPDAEIATLRAHAAELRQAGIRHVALFGSLARGEAGGDSDIDLVAELEPNARVGLFRLVGLERRLAAVTQSLYSSMSIYIYFCV